jgi:hypothetical protein
MMKDGAMELVKTVKAAAERPRSLQGTWRRFWPDWWPTIRTNGF